MDAPFDDPDDPVAPERKLLQPANENGASPSRGSLFVEGARIEIGSKMGCMICSYSAVLTASNVRGMRRRKEQSAADPAPDSGTGPWPEERVPRRHLQRWEDDGGT